MMDWKKVRKFDADWLISYRYYFVAYTGNILMCFKGLDPDPEGRLKRILYRSGSAK